MKNIIHFFDKLEDYTRSYLSHYPIIYSIIGAVGIVEVWRGVWHLSDDLQISSISSIVIGFFLLLSTGLMVSFFIGDSIVITGLRREKKLAEKTEEEIKLEADELKHVQAHIYMIEKSLEEIKITIKNNSSNK